MNPSVEINKVDEYIAGFPKDTQVMLNQLRATIKKAAPEAEEVIKWSMPAYKQNGILAFFAGYKFHIGFYPTGSGIAAFKKEIAKYKNSKGAVQFPLDKALPVLLITKMIKFKVAANAQKAEITEALKKSKIKSIKKQ